MLRDDLLELQHRLTVPARRALAASAYAEEPAKIPPGEMTALPDFLVRARTPEHDERCRRLVEEDQKRALVGGVKGMFAAIDETERRR
jgi:hypothetical protein